MIPLTRAALGPLEAAFADWARRWYPRECCGLVVERGGALEAWPCDNLQDALHAADPQAFPRTAITAYQLDPRVVARVTDVGTLRAVVHSHTDAGTAYGAYFSDEDVLGALGGDPLGEPVLPGVDYVVLSVRGGAMDDLRLFRWDPAARRFAQAP